MILSLIRRMYLQTHKVFDLILALVATIYAGPSIAVPALWSICKARPFLLFLFCEFFLLLEFGENMKLRGCIKHLSSL